jgi:hypothetical protein
MDGIAGRKKEMQICIMPFSATNNSSIKKRLWEDNLCG